MKHHLIFLSLAAAAPFAPLAIHAASFDKTTHDQARQALQRGQILPLTRILEIVHARVPGTVIKVKLDDKDDDRFEYEVKVLTASGRVMEVEIDARTGRILEIEED